MLYEMVRASGEPLCYRGWAGQDMPGAKFLYYESAVLPFGPEHPGGSHSGDQHAGAARRTPPRRAGQSQDVMCAGLRCASFLLLTGCAPLLGRRAAERCALPMLADDFFVARDGARLPLRRWEAQGNPRAVIVALHGMSDYSNAFDMPGRYWAKLGITTLAYDQRGFGRATNPGIWAGADVMRADLDDAVARRPRALSRRAGVCAGRKHGRGGAADGARLWQRRHCMSTA